MTILCSTLIFYCSFVENGGCPFCFTDTLQCQEHRLNYLRQQCHLHNQTLSLRDYTTEELRQKVLFKYIIDDGHKVVLRAIQKSGCTSWKTLLLMNHLHINKTVKKLKIHNWNAISGQYGLKLFDDKNKDYMISTMSNYFTILTVRHPLARLESAFKDVMVRRRNVKKLTDSSVAHMFQKYVDTIIASRARNQHWLPFIEHTDPCAVPIE